MSWWNLMFAAKETDSASVKTDVSEEVGGLNIKTALEAHIKWKLRLMDGVEGSSNEMFDPRVVAQDNQCALGKWLYGQGGKDYGNSAEFKELVAAHANFHQCAGHVLDLTLAGKSNEAKTDIEGGAFAKAAHETSRHLMRLWRAFGV